MKYAGGWGFTEAYSLPIKIRHWFVQRLKKQLEDEREAQSQASRSSGRRS